FFFRAEDGIRDFHVTGVQTCALPISLRVVVERRGELGDDLDDAEGLGVRDGELRLDLLERGLGGAVRVGDGGRRDGGDEDLLVEIGRASCRESREIAAGGGGTREQHI